MSYFNNCLISETSKMKKCHQNTKAPNYTKIKPLVPIKCLSVLLAIYFIDFMT